MLVLQLPPGHASFRQGSHAKLLTCPGRQQSWCQAADIKAQGSGCP